MSNSISRAWIPSKKGLEIGATILTIITCAFVCGLLAVQLLERRAAQAGRAPSVIPVDSVLTSTGELAYASSERTILVGLNSKCRYCSESMPALKVLNDFAHTQGVARARVVAVGVEPKDTIARYLEENGLSTFQPLTVDRRSDVAPLAARTPSLVIVDRAGRVLAVWSGKMSPKQMELVLARLNQDRAS